MPPKQQPPQQEEPPQKIPKSEKQPGNVSYLEMSSEEFQRRFLTPEAQAKRALEKAVSIF
jgi:hypothetical protein